MFVLDWRWQQQSEERECSAFLQEELEGPPATPLIAFEEGCTTGYTRKLIVQQREKMPGAVLSKAFSSIRTRQPGLFGCIPNLLS